jgi:hypothetical protein
VSYLARLTAWKVGSYAVATINGIGALITAPAIMIMDMCKYSVQTLNNLAICGASMLGTAFAALALAAILNHVYTRYS